MGYRKFKAAQLFDGQRLLQHQTLITNEEGVVEAVVPADEAEGEAVDGMIVPGFVNCHCHLELSHMKGRIPEGTGLVDFVFKVVTERHHPEEVIAQAIAEAEEAMMHNGIVAVGDICNTASTLEQKKKERLSYYNFIEASGWLPAVAEARFERALELYQAFSATSPHASHTAIVPHAPYSVSEALWQQLQPYFAGRTASIHNQETAFEDEFFTTGGGDFERMYRLMKIDNAHHVPTGTSSLRAYLHKLTGAARILLVHNTFITQSDIDYVKNFDHPALFFCLCPNANLYIENCLPPFNALHHSGCAIVLGTDSLASNHSLDILSEIKTVRRHFPGIPLEAILQWATLNGAEALGMEATLGSFEKGKRPGVLLLQNDGAHVTRLL